MKILEDENINMSNRVADQVLEDKPPETPLLRPTPKKKRRSKPRSSGKSRKTPRLTAKTSTPVIKPVIKLVPSLVNDSIVHDVNRKPWRLGESVGNGNCGEIYLASDDISVPVTKENAKFVVKIEPHSNGPLFVEIHCLMAAASKYADSVNETLRTGPPTGLPDYIAFGSHRFNGIRYRFLVLQRLERDLQSLIKNGRMQQKCLLIVAIQTLNILEVLHERGYCHNDVKAANLMLSKCKFFKLQRKPITAVDNKAGSEKPSQSMASRDAESKLCSESAESTESAITTMHELIEVEEERIFLIDFGLATKFKRYGVHRPFITDRRRAHDGTLEFTSRDAHTGAHSRRSDLESLGYNLICWSEGYLPWQAAAMRHEEVKVQQAKEYLMSNARLMLQEIYGNQIPKYLGEFMHHIGQLAFHERPVYASYRKIFEREFQRLGYSFADMRLDSNEIFSTCISVKAELENQNVQSNTESMSMGTPLQVLDSNTVTPRTLRSMTDHKKLEKKKLSWLNMSPQDADKIAWERVEKQFESERRLSDVRPIKPRRYDGTPTYVILKVQERSHLKRGLVKSKYDENELGKDNEGSAGNGKKKCAENELGQKYEDNVENGTKKCDEKQHGTDDNEDSAENGKKKCVEDKLGNVNEKCFKPTENDGKERPKNYSYFL